MEKIEYLLFLYIIHPKIFNSIVNMRTVILPRIWKCISKYLHEIISISIII